MSCLFKGDANLQPALWTFGEQLRLVRMLRAVEVQAPRITNEGETITCSKAELVLTFNEEIVGTAALTMEAAEIPGSYTADISGITFNIPSMEDDQQLSIRLDVTLSNGQFLTAPGGTFSFLNGEMVSSVG